MHFKGKSSKCTHTFIWFGNWYCITTKMACEKTGRNGTKFWKYGICMSIEGGQWRSFACEKKRSHSGSITCPLTNGRREIFSSHSSASFRNDHCPPYFLSLSLSLSLVGETDGLRDWATEHNNLTECSGFWGLECISKPSWELKISDLHRKRAETATEELFNRDTWNVSRAKEENNCLPPR